MLERTAAVRPWQRYLVSGLIECGIVLLAVATAVVLRPDRTAHPERVSARVHTCDLRSTSAAQIMYTVTNGDRTRHAYKVELLIANAKAPFGAGVSLTGHIAPGSTATARALVPLTGVAPDADCTARATVYDRQSGHHG